MSQYDDILDIYLFFCTICLTSLAIRTYMSRRYVKSKATILFQEFVATWELVATWMELGLVEYRFGVTIALYFNFFFHIWRGIIWDKGYGCFSKPVDKFAARDSVAAYRMMHLLWAAESAGDVHHAALFMPVKKMNVNPIIGFLVEFFSTWAITFASKIIGFINIQNGKVMLGIDKFMMRYIARPMTGGFCNPILATVQCFTWEGKFIHIFVYWLGPVLGALSSSLISTYLLNIEKRRDNV